MKRPGIKREWHKWVVLGKRRWHRWFAVPLAIVLVAGTVMGVQLTRPAEMVLASNVSAANIILVGQDATDPDPLNHFTNVRFDIGWDNSWRDMVNWDASWIFIKYKVGGNPWQHATLDTTGHTAPTGSTITPAADGTGVFIYRDADGTGSVSYTGVELKWKYGADLVADNALVKVKVFAIEMVYVPQGAFYVGDFDNDLYSSFIRADGTYLINETLGPYQVTSEGEITVGTVDGNLYYDADNANAGDQGGPIPAAFPKGYGAFYVMKYEVSQGQYAEFLNTLTPTQQGNRYPAGNYLVNRQTLRAVDNVYGADANNNLMLNEAGDGEWRAHNWMQWQDGGAYADWAGLRPMSELAFEKAARGTAEVVDDEYAWGTTNIVMVTGVDNDGTATELATAGADNPNANYSNPWGIGGPLRNGAFSNASDTREEAGASYYGVMELSGNLWEVTVTVGNANGRLFTGLHGDGSLDAAGDPDVSYWPVNGGGISSGAGIRGSDWWDGSIQLLAVGDRYQTMMSLDIRLNTLGFRAVRTAP